MAIEDEGDPANGAPTQRGGAAEEPGDVDHGLAGGAAPAKTAEPAPGGGRQGPVAARRGMRRYVTRRNAFVLTLGVAVIVVALAILAFIGYRLGFVDRYLASQITGTLSEYGIRADIKYFHTVFGPRTVEMRDIDLYDATSNQKLGHVDRLLATVRIEDFYALNLHRDINLESLEIDGLEVWVAFDKNGISNFHNLKLPPPSPNQRILFSYSTARVQLTRGTVHYGDEQHSLSGEARNMQATVQPDNPSAPAASWMNTVSFAATNSSFVYDNCPVDNIDITARGRVNQTRAEIQEIVLRSPVAEAHLQGTMDDWRALRYQMQITSTVDLTQASDILQAGTTLRGAGSFRGTVTGEGSKYQVDGQIQSDALAADNIRLKAVNLTASGHGDGSSYEGNGRVVAELLTAGVYQLNSVQLAGQVMGTGTDFRWIGELRSAAARGSGATIASLILSDVTAEKRGDELTANASRASVGRLSASGATVANLRAGDIRANVNQGVTTASVASVEAGTIEASGARANNIAASGIDVTDREGRTGVTVRELRVGSVSAAGAQTGSINIAGVRLAIHDGRVEGSSSDIAVGTVAIAATKTLPAGRIEGVRLGRPVFTVEPSGSYRASADLSLGGGVLGQINLGAARAAVVATTSQIQLNGLTADILSGHASGNAVLSTAARGRSRVTVKFNDLELGNLLATVAKQPVPLAGRATGAVDLDFPGTDIRYASGTARADFTAEAGDESRGRTPLTGAVALTADRGLFNVQRADLQTPESQLTATGRFSMVQGNSDLNVSVTSTNARDLQNALLSSGLLVPVEDKLAEQGIRFGMPDTTGGASASETSIALGGRFSFNGTIRGQLTQPSIEGRASLDQLLVNGRNLGSLTLGVNTTPALVRIVDGRLAQPIGGGIQFTLDVPMGGASNIALDATLDRVDTGGLIAALPVGAGLRSSVGNLDANLSGHISVRGLPDAMTGNADLQLGPGSFAGESFQGITARAAFSGSTVNLESVDARFDAGHITASGTFDTTTRAFNVQASGQGIQLDRLAAFAGTAAGSAPQLSGTADLSARISGGNILKPTTYDITFDGTGHNVKINGRDAGALTLVGRTENRRLNVTFTTGLLGQPQTVTAQVDLSNESLPTSARLQLAGADLAPLFAALLPKLNVKVTGRATGTLLVEGNLADENGYPSLAGLRGSAEFTELGVQFEDMSLSAVSPLQIQFTRSEITFQRTQFTGTGTNVTLGGTAAIGPGGRQAMRVDGTLNLHVLESFSPNIFLTGTAEVAVRLGGTYEAPQLTGTVSLKGASFATLIGDERLTLANLNGFIRFNSTNAQLDSLTGTLGGGRITASGGVLLAGLTPDRYLLNVHAASVTLPFPADFRSTADADLEVRGTQRGQVIAGTVNLRRAEYTKDIELADLINRRGEGSLTEGTSEGSLSTTTQLDLTVTGRDALVVHNNIADVIGSVSLRIGGSATDPEISGRITATSGTLKFRNDRYELTRAFIDLPGGTGIDPVLNIEAESEIRGYRVIVSLTGPLSQPQASVRSDPSLPQADIVSLITTGNLSSTDTGTSALAQTGLGTATSLLTDALINAPVQRATDKLFGLNRFSIDPLIAGRGGASPTARLTVGRQINRNLTVTYSTNLTAQQNQVLAVEYRISNRLSFVAQYEQGAVNGLRSHNDVFSFEIRFRKRF